MNKVLKTICTFLNGALMTYGSIMMFSSFLPKDLASVVGFFFAMLIIFVEGYLEHLEFPNY